MATTEKTTEKKTKQVHATVPTEFFDALTERKWTARKEVVDIVKEALFEKAEREGWAPKSTDAADAPKAPAKA